MYVYMYICMYKCTDVCIYIYYVHMLRLSQYQTNLRAPPSSTCGQQEAQSCRNIFNQGPNKANRKRVHLMTRPRHLVRES